MTFPSVLTGVNVLCYLSNLPASLESLHSLRDSTFQSDRSQIGFHFLRRGDFR